MFNTTTCRLRDIISTNDTKQIGKFHISDKITNIYKTTY